MGKESVKVTTSNVVHARSDLAQEKQPTRSLSMVEGNDERLKNVESRVTLLEYAARSSRHPRFSSELESLQKGWPECVKEGTSTISSGVDFNIFALLGDAAVGCRNDDCFKTDYFHVTTPEDCARMCAALLECNFWSHGYKNQILMCFLHQTWAEGFHVAPKTCQPPAPNSHSLLQTIVGVFNSSALKRCDYGFASDLCPDPLAAVRTWEYGVRSLEQELYGIDHPHLIAVHHLVLKIQPFWNRIAMNESINKEDYEDVVYNFRQVFFHIFPLINLFPHAVNRLDVSLPRPTRGLLCSRSSCDVKIVD